MPYNLKTGFKEINIGKKMFDNMSKNAYIIP